MSQRYVDLSSDDDGRKDAEAKRKAYKRRSLGGPIYSREYFMSEVMTYTDAELFQQLKRYNFDCGPISGSTRKVCQKKLADKMVEGPPPPPPKMQRRSMGPTIRSLPVKLPEPEPGDDQISGSSGSDVEPEFEPDFIESRHHFQENSIPVNLNSRDHKKTAPAREADVTTESLLPSIQLKRIDKGQRSTPPPQEEHAKHPPKIQPMHKEKVKPRPKSSPGPDTGSKEEVSIWVQIIILLICLLITVFFLTYIQSTETLPSFSVAPPLTDTLVAPPLTDTLVPVESYNATQPSGPAEGIDALPPDPVPLVPTEATDPDLSSESSEDQKKKKKKKSSTSKKTKESQKGSAR